MLGWRNQVHAVQNNQTSEKVLRFIEKKQVARPWWEAVWSGALSRISKCLRRNSAVLQNSAAAADRTTSNRLTSFLQHVMWHARKVSRLLVFHGQTRGELSYIWWLKPLMRATHFSGSLRFPRSHNYKYVGPTVFTLSPELPPNDACFFFHQRFGRGARIIIGEKAGERINLFEHIFNTQFFINCWKSQFKGKQKRRKHHDLKGEDKMLLCFIGMEKRKKFEEGVRSCDEGEYS